MPLPAARQARALPLPTVSRHYARGHSRPDGVQEEEEEEEEETEYLLTDPLAVRATACPAHAAATLPATGAHAIAGMSRRSRPPLQRSRSQSTASELACPGPREPPLQELLEKALESIQEFIQELLLQELLEREPDFDTGITGILKSLQESLKSVQESTDTGITGILKPVQESSEKDLGRHSCPTAANITTPVTAPRHTAMQRTPQRARPTCSCR